MDFDSFMLRELKYRGEGQGRTFRTPGGQQFAATLATIDGTPHVVRVKIEQVDRRGRRLADLGSQDVHFAPEQDLEALVMKNIRLRLFEAPASAATAEQSERLAESWGKPKPARRAKAG